MGIFIAMYIGLLLTWGISSCLSKQTAIKFSWLTGFLILWLIQALRYEYIGTDLEFYVPTFKNGNWDIYSIESGYTMLNSTLREYTKNPNILLALISFLALFPISYIYKKYSQNIPLSYIIFASFVVYHFTFSGLRQAIAIGITTFSYIFIDRQKVLLFLTCVLIASLFHVSSICFIVYYPLCNWLKMTNRKYFLAVMFGCIVILCLKPILESVIPMIFGGHKYLGYIQKETIPAYNLIIIIFTIFLFTFIVKSPSRQLQNYRMAVFCAVMSQALGLISMTATRIGFYFIPFIALAIPQTLFEAKESSLNKNVIASGITAFMIFFFFYAYSGGYLDVIPYKFYWE